MVIHNVIRYVIIQKQYKSWFIVSFYVLSVLLLFQDIAEHLVQMLSTSMIGQYVTFFKKASILEKINFAKWLVSIADCMGYNKNLPIFEAFASC